MRPPSRSPARLSPRSSPRFWSRLCPLDPWSVRDASPPAWRLLGSVTSPGGWAAVGLVVGPLCLAGGCDDAAASDRQARQAMAQTRAAIAGSPDEARQRIVDVRDDALTAATRTQVAATRAIVEERAAAELLRSLGEKRLEADRIVGELRRLAFRIGLAQAAVRSTRLLDPRPAIEAAEARLNEIEQGPVWTPAEQAQIPALATVREDVTRLEAQIAERRGESERLNEQRLERLRDAERLEAEAGTATGRRAVDLFRQSAEARQQAGDLSTERFVTEAQVEPLEADLAVARARQAALTAAVDLMRRQRETLQAGRQALLSTELPRQQEAVRTLVGVDDTPSSAGGTLSALASRWREVNDEADALAASAEARLTAAAEAYAAAATAADQVSRDAGQRTAGLADASNHPATLLSRTLHPSNYRLRGALVRSALGSLHANEAGQALRLNRVSRSLADALGGGEGSEAIDFPQGLPNPTESAERFGNAVDAADAAYAAAVEPLENVSQGTAPPSVADAARVASVYTHYAWAALAGLEAQLADRVGADPASADATARRQQRLAIAAEAARQAEDAGRPVRPLPSGLAGLVPAAPAAPVDEPPAADTPVDDAAETPAETPAGPATETPAEVTPNAP